MAQQVAVPPKERYIPNGLKFAFGGLAGMAATCVVQPLDLIKTRMQLSGGGKTSFAVAGEIVAREGFFSLYTGLSAGLLRQATYTTTRLGIYNWLFDAYKERNEGAAPGFGVKTLLGVAAGSVGAFVGTPAEVALIRMTADGRLPKEQRRNYKNVLDALMRIVREEGLLKLWRGASPTVSRAMVVNAAQLSTYSQAREVFVGRVPEGILLHFCASMVSGLVTTIASMPVDIIKTRIQNAAKGESQLAVVSNLLRNEGVFSLWKGFLPYYARLGPHTVLTFIFLEQLNAAYFKYT
ncbi:mitochondrial 2-oxoglutarate/malate carrier protein-like [Danaus plexippus]|uniref:Mitochondrial 2-oxoglutarate/malate carrier protein n=1 Tax=Danaus plexippus plexippus TaxID=278856 RepID=A0A212FJM8_DANPL|nr:mitochondrial 2-oxoglutarate/malate carrier protein-like [Danaus plexippus]OWR53948.1 2-oxoglutarate/malate carrier protein [Danaus plexippus plexippus]